jgi:Flp pilus assembly protein TadG
MQQPRKAGFGRDERGTSAIEFALLAAPFFIFLILIIEIALVFLVGQVLENATQDAARLIRTGRAEDFSKESFTQSICDRLRLPRCEGNLKVDVRVVPDFDSVDLSVPVSDGALNDGGFRFDVGRGNDIVVVRAFYEWPVTPALPALIRFLGLRPELPPTGDYLLLATAVFRNEPFS